jgi:GNAT superfamily N-acetyltransferase
MPGCWLKNMTQNSRNSIEKDGWILTKPQQFDSFQYFDCIDSDLNEYFQKDIALHRLELLSEVYILKEATMESELPVALVDLCNDSIRREKVKDIEDLKIFCSDKHYPSYPAVKITRFGVHHEFQNNNIGSFVLNMLKDFFVTDNRTACRFITVDAYNNDKVLCFYAKNYFQFFSNKDVNKETRSMFFDLKRLLSPD